MSKLKFETEGDSIFAITQNDTYKGKLHDELMYAEIQRKDNVCVVTWEDDFKTKINFSTEELAKSHILRDYLKHKPHSNGNSYEL